MTEKTLNDEWRAAHPEPLPPEPDERYWRFYVDTWDDECFYLGENGIPCDEDEKWQFSLADAAAEADLRAGLFEDYEFHGMVARVTYESRGKVKS